MTFEELRKMQLEQGIPVTTVLRVWSPKHQRMMPVGGTAMSVGVITPGFVDLIPIGAKFPYDFDPPNMTAGEQTVTATGFPDTTQAPKNTAADLPAAPIIQQLVASTDGHMFALDDKGQVWNNSAGKLSGPTIGYFRLCEFHSQHK